MPANATLTAQPAALLSPGRLINALAPRARSRLTEGLGYGPGARHRLDVHSPFPRLAAAPVVVFFYGGGWEDGDRGFYRFAGAALAERGIVAVVPDYRLFPEVRFPGFLEDAAEAVAWVQAEIDAFGGDPDRVFLMGHSAGAYIAAMLALDPAWLSGSRAASLAPLPKLRGVIGLAGPYDFLPLHTEVLRAIFGPPETLWQTQPIHFVSAGRASDAAGARRAGPHGAAAQFFAAGDPVARRRGHRRGTRVPHDRAQADGRRAGPPAALPGAGAARQPGFHPPHGGAEMIGLLLAVLLGLVAAMSFAWLVQILTGNCSWVDVVWSFGTGAAGVAFALAPLNAAGPNARQIAVAVLVAAWSLRLGGHIALRAAAGQDDPRYADLRRQWGAQFQRRLFAFLMVQALVAWGLALSMLLAARNPAPGLRLLDLLGIAVLAVAVAGEAMADNQLRRFKLDPANRGQVCDAGLWSWSRHPNYFFEWLGWIAYPLFAIGAGWPWGWLALTGPALMFWALRHASGVPPLEAHMLRRYGEAFRSLSGQGERLLSRPAPQIPRRASTAWRRKMSFAQQASRMAEILTLPDSLTSYGINRLVGRTRRKLASADPGFERDFAAAMARRPIAEFTEDANAQHYEVPAEFFGLVLGPRRKYSCCLYDTDAADLTHAEERALATTCANAGLADGQDILELGCGWGSLSLWMAERYPNARIVSVSNSRSQREFIERQAREHGLNEPASDYRRYE